MARRDIDRSTPAESTHAMNLPAKYMWYRGINLVAQNEPHAPINDSIQQMEGLDLLEPILINENCQHDSMSALLDSQSK